MAPPRRSSPYLLIRREGESCREASVTREDLVAVRLANAPRGQVLAVSLPFMKSPCRGIFSCLQHQSEDNQGSAPGALIYQRRIQLSGFGGGVNDVFTGPSRRVQGNGAHSRVPHAVCELQPAARVSVRIKLTRKLSNALNDLDLRPYSVGDVIDLAAPSGEMLVAEGWAERVVGSERDTADERPRTTRERLNELLADAPPSVKRPK